MRYDEPQWHDAPLCSTYVRCTPMYHNAPRCATIRCVTMCHNALRCATMRHSRCATYYGHVYSRVPLTRRVVTRKVTRQDALGRQQTSRQRFPRGGGVSPNNGICVKISCHLAGIGTWLGGWGLPQQPRGNCHGTT